MGVAENPGASREEGDPQTEHAKNKPGPTRQQPVVPGLQDLGIRGSLIELLKVQDLRV